MCKKVESQRKAIDAFFDKLRGESYSRTYAIYERSDDGRPDLLGFAAFVEGVLNFFELRSDESIRIAGMVPYPQMGAKGIAHHFGGDYAVAI